MAEFPCRMGVMLHIQGVAAFYQTFDRKRELLSAV